MRRWSAIAALSTMLLAAPLLAQMHGGSRGGASMGRGGFSSHGSVGFRGGASFGSAARLGSAPRFGAAFGTGLRQPAFRSGSSFGGSRQPVFGSRHFHHRVFLGSVFPGSYGYYGYPTYYGDAFYSTPDYYPGYDYYGSSYSGPANSAQNDIAQQQQDIDRLEDEVARLQEQRETPQPEARETPDVQKESPSEPTLLVFRDKHTQEVENYAIVGGTLWIFSEQRATKLPLSWLDIEATTKANDDRGVNFQVPR